MMFTDTPSTTIIDRRWPVEGLETVDCCPYCGSTDRRIAHRDVQDWSFYCAPGKWTYWTCNSCDSLHLNPRPTQQSIRLAYSSYYTHRGKRESLLEQIRERIRNEYWSSTLNADFRPRLHLSAELHWIVNLLHLSEPFSLKELASLPVGRLMDVGCGNGNMLRLAEGLGWNAVGLEVDSAAVQFARSRGLDVVEGSYPRLLEYSEEFDCIICSHVLEHVHDPIVMISNLSKALKPNGVLLLSLPNASSQLRVHFGNDWRGLEAPRHLTIPSLRRLEAILSTAGFSVRQVLQQPIATAVESARIQRRGARITRKDIAAGRRLASRLVISSGDKFDFLELVCVKRVASSVAFQSAILQAEGNKREP
jgi:2-polyprenyl-3-methyl-5-hydroxy-6-metoxy-1,4-benzoquinol methylase